MATTSITSALGVGSGIDTAALVEDLVEAQFAAKTAQIDRRGETLTAQISAVGRLKSGLSGFSSALTALARSGSLATQPVSANPAVIRATAIGTAAAASIDTQVEVRQLASPQVASTAPMADSTVPLGGGTLTFRFGSATIAQGAMAHFEPGGRSVDVPIPAADSTLEGIARAINAADAGVTASVLADATGARLVLKGASGSEQAFTLSVTGEGASGALAALAIGVEADGTTIGSAASDAIVAVDGIAVRRPGNIVEDVLPGVRLDLATAQPGSGVRIASAVPTDALRQAVGDFVETYNQLVAMLRTETDAATGALRNDPAARALQRSLAALTLTPLTDTSAGTPATLSEIGVATQRDGSLKVDSARLAEMLAAHPAAVEAMFALGAAASGDGLPAALAAISAGATSGTAGLGGSEARYTEAARTVAEDQSDAIAAAEALRTRMTRQFARSEAAVAAYQSTQSFLEQQIDAWNRNGR